MRKIISILYFLLLVNTIINAQRYKISGDSLLKLCTAKDVYSVFDSTNLNRVDPKDCYHNEKLRPYLLAVLDKNAWFEYNCRNYIKRVFDSGKTGIYEVERWLANHNQRDLIDTVMKTPVLFQVYLDSVIARSIEHYREKNFGRLPSEVLSFHARLKLPEAYKILYKYWKESGGGVNNDYFFVMLAMHDPEAIDMYNVFVDNAIKNKDMAVINKIKRVATYEYVYGSYAIDLQLKLLVLTDKTFYSHSYDNNYAYCPYNINILHPYTTKCFNYSENDTVRNIINGIYDPIDKIHSLSYEEVEKYGIEVKQNIDVFRRAAEPCIQELKEKEHYWKSNMPYVK